MDMALSLAEEALRKGQAPFGAVLADEAGAVLGSGHNQVGAEKDPTAHAEVVALRDAWRRLGEKRALSACTLFTSCEPCLMCAFVIAQFRIPRVVFAARGTDVPVQQRLLDADLSQAAAWIEAQPGWSLIALRGGLMRERALRVMQRFDWG